MTTNQTSYPSAANLVGNASIPRNINPTLRAGARRLDPDGVSNVPYYAGVVGKTLQIQYSDAALILANSAVTLTANSLAQIIADINAADPTNLLAVDEGGFLTIINKNVGKTHYLTLLAFGPAPHPNDAGPLMGFAVAPFPGSTSYAGEYASTIASRREANTQAAALIGIDEDLSAKTFNRAFYALLQMVETMRADLNREVVVHKDIQLNFVAHAGDLIVSAKVNSDAIRLFYPEINNPTTTHLNPFYRVTTVTGDDEVLALAQNAVEVVGLFYATAGTPFVSTVFANWGTPDGGEIVSATTINKTKHADTAITSIVGNIVACAAATFVTNKVGIGDPVFLTASNLQPFDHSGWFAVDDIIDETHLSLRPMTIAEQTPTAFPNDVKPRWMNPSAGGTLRVAMGRFIPAGDVWIGINGLTGTYRVRISCGVPFHATLIDDQARMFTGTLNKLASLLYAHLTAASNAHAATAITGFTSATTWKDGTTITGADLKSTIEDVLRDLGAFGVGDSGGARIGAEAVSIGGGTPNTLAAGSVAAQLTELLTDLRNHVNSSTAHLANNITYAGGGNWADGTTNPAATVEAQLDKVISDLAGAAGTGKIQGVVVGTDLAVGTLQAQIADLAANWLKMARTNSISGLQTFTALLTATKNLLVGGDFLANETDALKARVEANISVAASTEYTLMWESGRNGETTGTYTKGVSRLYASANGSWVFTINAQWTGTVWDKDIDGTAAMQVNINAATFDISFRDASADADWADNAWTDKFFSIDQATALATIKNSIITGDGINLQSPVQQLKAGSDSQAALLLDAQGHSSLGNVAIDPMGDLYRKGLYLFDDFYGTALGSVWAVTNVGGGSDAFIGSHEWRTQIVPTLNNYRQIAGQNVQVSRKHFPRFRTRLRTNDLNHNNVLGEACGIQAGIGGGGGAQIYFYYSQQIHDTHWWLSIDGTDYDTGIVSIMDAGTGASASQILHFAVTGARTVQVAIHNSSVGSPEVWTTAGRALITHNVDISTNVESPFVKLMDEFGQTGAPQLFIDFIELTTANRAD